MSQIYKSLASGPTPPGIVSSLVADDADNLITAISQPNPSDVSDTANKIQLNGDNGIVTYKMEALSSGDTNVLQIAFNRGFITTTDATPTNILVIGTASNACFTLQILVSAFCTSDVGNPCAGGYATATFKNVGGTVSIVDVLDYVFNSDAALNTSTFNISASGSNIIISVTGVAGKTIQWGTCTPGIVAT